MVGVRVGFATGKCPRCGRTVRRRLPADTAVCDCWRYCPIDHGKGRYGTLLQPYSVPMQSYKTYAELDAHDIPMTQLNAAEALDSIWTGQYCTPIIDTGDKSEGTGSIKTTNLHPSRSYHNVLCTFPQTQIIRRAILCAIKIPADAENAPIIYAQCPDSAKTFRWDLNLDVVGSWKEWILKLEDAIQNNSPDIEDFRALMVRFRHDQVTTRYHWIDDIRTYADINQLDLSPNTYEALTKGTKWLRDDSEVWGNTKHPMGIAHVCPTCSYHSTQTPVEVRLS